MWFAGTSSCVRNMRNLENGSVKPDHSFHVKDTQNVQRIYVNTSGCYFWDHSDSELSQVHGSDSQRLWGYRYLKFKMLRTLLRAFGPWVLQFRKFYEVFVSSVHLAFIHNVFHVTHTWKFNIMKSGENGGQSCKPRQPIQWPGSYSFRYTVTCSLKFPAALEVHLHSCFMSVHIILTFHPWFSNLCSWHLWVEVTSRVIIKVLTNCHRIFRIFQTFKRVKSIIKIDKRSQLSLNCSIRRNIRIDSGVSVSFSALLCEFLSLGLNTKRVKQTK
jgi:hypothetical protein